MHIGQFLTRAAQAALIPVAVAIVKLPWLEGYRRRLLQSGVRGEALRGVPGLLYPSVHYLWLRLDYWREPDPDRRTQKAMLAMGGDAGVDLARNYNVTGLDFGERVGELTLWEANPTYETVQTILGGAPDGCRVIQVGSSSGREIAWVAEGAPGARCIGTDLVPEVVEYSSAVFDLPNLEFAVVSAKEVGDFARSLGDGPVVVFASGSMQQVQPEHVELFFEGLATLPQVEVVLTESASLSGRDPLTIPGSKPREWFDYSHNYRHYAERHGFATVEARLIRPYSEADPLHGTTAHYFFWGRRGEPIASAGSLADSSRPTV